MVHGVRLRGGKAEWYRNRWVRSKAVAAQRDERGPAGPVHGNMDFAANTCIIAHAGRPLPRRRPAGRPTLGWLSLGWLGQRGHVGVDEAGVHADHQGALVVQLKADAAGQRPFRGLGGVEGTGAEAGERAC